ncbi:MAG: ABC-type transport auxiliary lipoprotein family protein [Sulfurimonas sp.]|nr:ABC-type transport auxiliary lipoprotein family protein [Sulfurimonas sp.]
MKLISIIIIFILSGCTTVKLSITEYKIVAESPKIKSNKDGCRNKSLKIAQAFSSSSLMSLKMDYAQGENKVFSYSQAHWNESPNHSITMNLLKEIRDSSFFKNVQISKTISRNSWILEINIEDFLQYYSKDLKNSFARATINLTLIDSKNNTIIDTKTFTSKVDVKTLNAEGGVEALNAALSNILTQNVEWLNEVCK